MNDDTNIADLLRALRDETTTLVREEIALARTELSEKLALLTRNLAYLAVGAMASLAALLMLLTGFSVLLSHWFAERGLNTGFAGLMGFMVVSILVGTVSAALVAKALKTLSGSSIKLDRTVRSLHEDKAWAQEKLS